MDMTVKDPGLPPVFLESLQRKSGVILFAGTLESGLKETMDGALKGASDRKMVAWADALKTGLPSSTLIAIPPHADIDLEAVLRQAEAGHLVLWLMHAPTPLTALRRILSFQAADARRHLLARFADQILLMSGQMRVASIAGNGVAVFEMILMTPVLKEALTRESLVEFDTGLREGVEGSGIVSYNQSLLQLLLRRTIDIKAAFEATRDPMNLDQILKKVGI